MRKIKVLDCTLRDGGRLFNCEFSDTMIKDISTRLEAARIDIIEMGFLRSFDVTKYSGNSTFFNQVSQITPLLPCARNRESMFVAFIDYGLFDIESLEEKNEESIDGIRFGFTKRDFIKEKKEIIKYMEAIISKGYLLFIQDVNTPGYSDKELIELIDVVNSVNPFSFGLVDTYGTMYEEDLVHYLTIIDNRLDSLISIDFHSHNNFQMSFALAQKATEFMNNGRRDVIIDATLNGMGKGAGNLNLELIIDYLIRKKNYNYEMDWILDIIDEYLADIKRKNTWGYSIPGLYSGIYRCHPNNMLYMMDKYDLSSKDIKTILSMINPDERERYDYEALQRICERYKSIKVNDIKAVDSLRDKLFGKSVLLIMPGSSVRQYEKTIADYYTEEKCLAISVNFYYKSDVVQIDYAFFGSSDRYKDSYKKIAPDRIIVTSQINSNESNIVVDYESLVERGHIYFDNSAIMCLNLLKKCGIRKLAIAGFDGYKDEGTDFYYQDMNNDVTYGESKRINDDIQNMFSEFCKTVEDDIDICLLTPSIYLTSV